MERRIAARRDQLLAEAEADPRIPRGVLARLERFPDPFVELLAPTLHARRVDSRPPFGGRRVALGGVGDPRRAAEAA